MSQARFPFAARKSLVAALLVAATAASHAAGGVGEALEIELPSMRTPVEGTSALTRAQVQAELRQAREAGTLSMNGELSDSDMVLAARERFNAAQAETIMAAYRAEDARIAALVEAERLRAEAQAAQLALATGRDNEAQLSLEFIGGGTQ